MASIESKMFYGDNSEIFKSLFGFEIADVQERHTNEGDEDVTIIKCVNKHNVEIDILIQENTVSITEPFAVNEDLTPIEFEHEKENRILPTIE